MVSPAPVPASHVLPPLVGGLHCGCTTTARRSAGRRVLPPLVGGLHCGTRSVPAMVTDGSECSRRWSAGSIAAATGQAPSTRQAPSAPAAGRRAPLRHDRRGAVGSVLRPVLPPLVGGPHCGMILLPKFDPLIRECSRRWSAGSIAAARPHPSLASSSPSAPAAGRRAPLRLSRPAREPDRYQVLPPLVGGLHCGASTNVDFPDCRGVLPPLVGGL